MHGNNPTRDWIEGELTRHAAEGRIRSWKRLPLNYGGAPKWEVQLNDVHVTGDHCGVPTGQDGIPVVPLKTYQEGKLFCAALASAEWRYRRAMDEAAETVERYREAAGIEPGQDDTEYLTDYETLDRALAGGSLSPLEVPFGFTLEVLREAFERVCCVKDWKDPVSCELPADLTPDDVQLITAAVMCFTGTMPEWSRDGDGGNWNVRAAGYYASIETAAVLADPDTMAAIVEAEAETGPVSPELRQAADDAWMMGPSL